MDFDKIIDEFNNGDFSILLRYFNNYETFFTILQKRGLLGEIDFDSKNSVDWLNSYIVWTYENNKQEFLKLVLQALSDVEYENDTYYLILDTPGVLNKLFCNSRNDISQESIEKILDGNYDYFFDNHTTENIYEEVIEELSKDNLSILKNHIIEKLDGIDISPDTETLESISKEQNSEFVIVNNNNIDKITNDEETMKYLLNNYLHDLNSSLYSIHSTSYESAYSDMIYDQIWDKLDTLFVGKGEYISRKHQYKKDTSVETFKIEIYQFESTVLSYLKANSGYHSSALSYFGSYFELLKDDNDCLSFRPYDYPDNDAVSKNINNYFEDYI